jgi:protein-tyrosine phosphatase
MASSDAETDPPDQPVRILFVCLGNICRSPTAEAIMRSHLEAAGLAHRVEVDSAGTVGWHRGEPADERARAEAARRGIEMTSRARQVHLGDFEYFDLIVAMDTANAADLRDLTSSREHRAKVRLLREFDGTGTGARAASGSGSLDVPDPYYGGPDGFADVFDLIDAACRGLLAHVESGST